jgi:hypothetical protein
MTYTEAVDNVARGAALLDKKYPGWDRRIDMNALDMSNECACVLGQLEGPYWSAIERMWPDGAWRGRAASHGFNLAYDINDSIDSLPSQFDLLQLAWTELITARRRDQALATVVWTHREVESVG